MTGMIIAQSMYRYAQYVNTLAHSLYRDISIHAPYLNTLVYSLCRDVSIHTPLKLARLDHNSSIDVSIHSKS